MFGFFVVFSQKTLTHPTELAQKQRLPQHNTMDLCIVHSETDVRCVVEVGLDETVASLTARAVSALQEETGHHDSHSLKATLSLASASSSSSSPSSSSSSLLSELEDTSRIADCMIEAGDEVVLTLGPTQRDRESAAELLRLCEKKHAFSGASSFSHEELVEKVLALDPYNSRALALRCSYEVHKANPGMSPADRCKRVISLHPTDAYYYNSLATHIKRGEATELEDGRIMTKQELYQCALRFDDSCALAYCNLAATLESFEATTELHGAEVTQEELYLRSIDADSSSWFSFFYLARSLPEGHCVTLHDGTSMSKVDLLKRVLALHPACTEAAKCLAHMIPVGGATVLENGQVKTRVQLLGAGENGGRNKVASQGSCCIS